MKKGYTPAIILLIILSITSIVFVGYYYFFKQKTIHKSSEYTQAISPSPETKIATNLSLQNILSTNCYPYKITPTSPETTIIDPRNLPLNFDPTIIKLDGLAKESVTCAFAPEKYFVFLNDFVIYDEKSEDLGHGGPSYIGIYGEEIENDGVTRIGIYINWPEFMPENERLAVNAISVSARGTKTLKFNNFKIYVNMDKTIIHAGDIKLANFLKEYLDKNGQIKSDGTEKALAHLFFKDQTNLNISTTTAIAEMKKTLNGISAK